MSGRMVRRVLRAGEHELLWDRQTDGFWVGDSGLARVAVLAWACPRGPATHPGSSGASVLRPRGRGPGRSSEGGHRDPPRSHLCLSQAALRLAHTGDGAALHLGAFWRGVERGRGALPV